MHKWVGCLGTRLAGLAGHETVLQLVFLRHWYVDRVSLFGLKECVGECDGGHSGHGWVVAELWVDVEEHRHVHLSTCTMNNA